jgi:hypothetical protein
MTRGTHSKDDTGVVAPHLTWVGSAHPGATRRPQPKKERE